MGVAIVVLKDATVFKVVAVVLVEDDGEGVFFIAPIVGEIITQLIDVMIFLVSHGRIRLLRLYSHLILHQVLLLTRKLMLPLHQLLHLLVSLSLCLERSTMP